VRVGGGPRDTCARRLAPSLPAVGSPARAQPCGPFRGVGELASRGGFGPLACGRARAGSAAGARSVFRVLGGRVRMRREDRAWSRPTAVGLAQREGRHQGAVIRAAAASPRRGARRAPRLRKVAAFRRFTTPCPPACFGFTWCTKFFMRRMLWATATR
jgi:hypothetical protein